MTFDGTPAATRQRGTATATHSDAISATVAVTFPQAFATVPKVIVSSNRAGADFLVSATSITTTGCVIGSRYILNTAVTATSPVTWDAEV